MSCSSSAFDCSRLDPATIARVTELVIAELKARGFFAGASATSAAPAIPASAWQPRASAGVPATAPAPAAVNPPAGICTAGAHGKPLSSAPAPQAKASAPEARRQDAAAPSAPLIAIPVPLTGWVTETVMRDQRGPVVVIMPGTRLTDMAREYAKDKGWKIREFKPCPIASAGGRA